MFFLKIHAEDLAQALDMSVLGKVRMFTKQSAREIYEQILVYGEEKCTDGISHAKKAENTLYTIFPLPSTSCLLCQAFYVIVSININLYRAKFAPHVKYIWDQPVI